MAPPPGHDTAAASENDYRYHMVTPENTNLVQVFDDGRNTYLQFKDAPPTDLTLYTSEGMPLRFERFERYALAAGVYRGILVSAGNARSYAVPSDPDRPATVVAESLGKNPEQVAGFLPPDLAAVRARILDAKTRLRKLEAKLDAKLDPAAKPESAAAAAPSAEHIARELEMIETQIGSLSATLVRVHFPSGGTALNLSEQARSQLAAAAKVAMRVEVRGRTDARGSTVKNRRIALARALAAKQFLVSQGVEAKNIKISAVGRGDYLTENRTEQGRWRNRRVDIVLVNAKQESEKVGMHEAPGGNLRTAAVVR